MSMHAQRTAQRGMTMLVALVLLSILTLVVVTSFRVGQTTLGIVGNLQARAETEMAADSAIQEAISTTRVFQAPSTVFLNPCKGNNTRCYDVNGDGTDDVTVTLTPQPACVQAQIISNAALNLAVNSDAVCAAGAGNQFGIQGAATGDSLCANSVWEVIAQAEDSVTGAQSVVTEGVSIRVAAEDVATSCP